MILEVISFNFNLTYAPNHEDSRSCWRGVNGPRAGMASGNAAIFSVNPDST